MAEQDHDPSVTGNPEAMRADEIKCSDPDRCARGCMYSRCKAGSDGECNWVDCPQLIAHQGHCPLDICSWDIAALRTENADRDDLGAALAVLLDEIDGGEVNGTTLNKARRVLAKASPAIVASAQDTGVVTDEINRANPGE